MELKYFVENLDGVEESLKGSYEQSEGGYTLKVSGATSNTKLNEFRDNNVQLMKDIAKMKADFVGIDPAKVLEMQAELDKLTDEKLKSAGKTEELNDARLNRLNAAHEAELKGIKDLLLAEQEERKARDAKLQSYQIDNELKVALDKVGGLKQGALQDVLGRGRNVWKIVENKVAPIGTNGEVLHNDKGEVLTMDSWAQALITDAPFLFEDNTGGGGAGGSKQVASKSIQNSDRKAFANNLEDIAKGKIKIIQ